MSAAVVITIVGIITAGNVASMGLVVTLLSRRIDDIASGLQEVRHDLKDVGERLTTLEVKLGER